MANKRLFVSALVCSFIHFIGFCYFVNLTKTFVISMYLACGTSIWNHGTTSKWAKWGDRLAIYLTCFGTLYNLTFINQQFVLLQFSMMAFSVILYFTAKYFLKRKYKYENIKHKNSQKAKILKNQEMQSQYTFDTYFGKPNKLRCDIPHILAHGIMTMQNILMMYSLNYQRAF